jgi:hypothetical protein
VSQRREPQQIGFRLTWHLRPKVFVYVQITERSIPATFVLPVSAIAI